MYADALKDYFGVNTFSYSIQDSVGYSSLKFSSDIYQKPTLEEFNQIVENYKNVILPLKILRIQRNQLLASTDWWVLPDRTATQAQLDYRQSLRDLPANSSPELDANGNLINVNWPEKPE